MFLRFLSQHRRSYGTKAEFEFRLEVFTTNFNKILQHNLNVAKEAGFTLGINKFADMTESEFALRFGDMGAVAASVEEVEVASTADSYPTSVDWRAYGAVTPVKD